MATQQTRPIAQRTEQRRYSLSMLVGLAFVLAMLAICDTATAQTDNDFFDPPASLQVDAPYQLVGESAKLTATGYLPTSNHRLRIYDETTGTHLKTCGYSPCPVSVVQDDPTKHTYVAYIAKDGPGFPPPGIESSDHADVTWSSSLVLNTDTTDAFEGDKVKLTVESMSPPLWVSTIILIKDESGTTVNACASTTSCSTSVTAYGNVDHTYYALQNLQGPGPNLQVWRASNQVTVNWQRIPQ
jgi:hypothetical protein